MQGRAEADCRPLHARPSSCTKKAAGKTCTEGKSVKIAWKNEVFEVLTVFVKPHISRTPHIWGENAPKLMKPKRRLEATFMQTPRKMQHPQAKHAFCVGQMNISAPSGWKLLAEILPESMLSEDASWPDILHYIGYYYRKCSIRNPNEHLAYTKCMLCVWT